jgi:hypothetical protein
VPISAALIEGIDSPVALATPASEITPPVSAQYTGTVTWSPAQASFGYSTIYTATITLTAELGYTFRGGFGNTAQIAGFRVNTIAPTWVSNNGATLVFQVQFLPTGPAPTYSIISSPSSISFSAVEPPYTQPTAQTVTITNNGTASITLTQPTATYYDIGVLSTTFLPINGSTATFTVRPKAGLGLGTYLEPITINGSNSTSATIVASFSVTLLNYTIIASPLNSFGSLKDYGISGDPYIPPSLQTVTITNTGTGSITLSQPTSTNYDIGPLSTTSLPINGSTATFTVRPKAGLAAGVYNETITINGNSGASAASATVSAIFSVIATYNAIIANGGGGGRYAEDEIVTITAIPPAGQQFKQWEVIYPATVTFVQGTNVNSPVAKFSMPAVDNIIINATYEPIPILYAVTVVSDGTGESGGGDYMAGETVQKDAGEPPTGMQFKNWTSTPSVTFNNANSVATSFIMPENAVTVTANFEIIPPTKYTVTVNSSGVTPTGSGAYAAGDIVTIHAGTHPELEFENWTSTNPNVMFDDANSANTTFVMPASAVTVTANFGPPTGIDDHFAPDLKIYPNPFAGAVRIAGAEGCTLRIMNIAGAVVHTQKITGSDETLQLEHLLPGVYFFRIEKGIQVKTIKTIKN